jgi:hypothetical protein
MRRWLARQYNDVRGNFKWAILLGLWYAISHYGKKVLELIPNISPWMVWTIIVLASATAFVWIAKVENKKSVVTAIQQTQAQPSAIVPGIPTLSALRHFSELRRCHPPTYQNKDMLSLLRLDAPAVSERRKS